ncbi:hypothetical protein B0T17DRAFT_87297 [Bombardia bombarda]|uniref:Zn(2)-C6 fungal-type domain-containing protein n=1 Tax=Bombardia bombarda TaxID=252184 RepID=A0AA40CFA6_9PEZI|nr:hypothetical protein B0T17DRAFT_87297 [Bombardia bombarda]
MSFPSLYSTSIQPTLSMRYTATRSRPATQSAMPSQSLSVMERANPPPRRKSCASCIKAKRRCTLETPACQRCIQRKMDCRYLSGTNSKRRPPPPPCPPAAAGVRPVQPGSRPKSTPALQVPAAAIPTPDQSHAAWSLMMDNINADMDVTFSSLSLPNVVPNSWDCGVNLQQDFSLECSAPLTNSLGDFGSIYESLELDEDPGNLGMMEQAWITKPYAVPGSVPTLSQGLITYLIRTRLQYAIDNIIAAPRSMLMENRTPWSHPRLYEYSMPRSMEDALSSCALYVAKTPINSHVILRSIESRVRELVASPMPLDPFGILARTQALLLYQIMRLFDDDPQVRSSAEQTAEPLEQAALTLLTYTSFDEPLLEDTRAATALTPPLSPPLQNAGPTAFWDSWVFQESARRTSLITFVFMSMYRLIRGDTSLFCDHRTYLCHKVTLSACLWQAADAPSFEVAWREKDHFMVQSISPLQPLNNARGDEIDVFGKILISAIIGVKETRQWLAGIGGVL